MYQINFSRPMPVHFIGIGGVSMSGLAQILMDKGFAVSGSDKTASALTQKLTELGAAIHIGQSREAIPENTALVIYTAAIAPDNEELVEARRRGLPLLSRAEFLGQLMRNYETSIAVSGTHGKTTTTSMLAEVLLADDLDPTISVGGVLRSIDGNIRVGHSGVFITEACEYTNSFLQFYPSIGIILNIEEDHLDFFKDIADIRHSFKEFASHLPKDGVLIINGEIPDFKELTEDLPCRVITYGLGTAYDYGAVHIRYDEFARGSFDLIRKKDPAGGPLPHFGLGVTGKHNISNALPVIALADILAIPQSTVSRGLLSFTGTDRRFEFKGTVNGFTVIDDYAHHPTEITATLKTAGRYPHREIWCVFQPHTYTRTKAFFQEFAKVLQLADHVILADIYAARETDTLGTSSALLAKAVKENGTDALYLPGFEEIEAYLLSHAKPRDLVLTMGAGNVVEIANHLVG